MPGGPLPAPVLQTARLVMTPLGRPDFEPLFAIWSDPRVTEHLFRRPTTREEFEPVFTTMLDGALDPGMWCVRRRESDAVIGRCGFYLFGEDRTPEIAYLLDGRHWGVGLATEMAQACLEFGFGVRRWTRIVALTKASNAASIRVLTKLGMTRVESTVLADVGVTAELFELSLEHSGP